MSYLNETGLDTLWAKIKNTFQAKLVSGTNIKTINNNSLLGSGNIVIEGGSGGAVDSVNGKTGAVVLSSNDIRMGTTTSLGETIDDAIETLKDDKSDTGHTHTASQVSGLATVATSGKITDLTGTLAIANGGTGATTVSAAKTNLGIPTYSVVTGSSAIGSASTGTSSARSVRRYGNIRTVAVEFYKNSTTAAGANLYEATLANSGDYPLTVVTSGGFYGTHALGITIDTSGAITVRNASATSIAAVASSATHFFVSVTYIVN